MPANIRDRISTRISNFVGNDIILAGVLPFRHLIKNGAITMNDLYTKTYKELERILDCYEITQYEEYEVQKYINEQNKKRG